MSSPSDSDNDSNQGEKPELSDSTLAALQAFYTEKTEREEAFANLQAEAEERLVTASSNGTIQSDNLSSTLQSTSKDDVSIRAGRDPEEGIIGSKKKKPLSMQTFTEDWNASQFWYDEHTAGVLAKRLLEGADGERRIAVVSAPSAFVALRNLLDASPLPASSKPTIYLLEYDRRFSVFPEFVFYDFQHPFRLPPSLKGTIDTIILDPPFLSTDCQTKAALTVRWLSKTTPIIPSPIPSPTLTSQPSPHSHTPSSEQTKIIICTGERMTPLIHKLYAAQGVRATNFEPAHAKGLSNEFWCFANFLGKDAEGEEVGERWQWRDVGEGGDEIEV